MSPLNNKLLSQLSIKNTKVYQLSDFIYVISKINFTQIVVKFRGGGVKMCLGGLNVKTFGCNTIAHFFLFWPN